jgi:protein-tyrosine phosphatase
MIDIHCHLLPGLDDGPSLMDVSLEMAEMAAAEGITHVVATPHASGSYEFISDLVQKKRDEIQSLIGNRLQILTGCDFHLNFDNLQDAHAHPAKYTINQKNYLLVEFSDFAIPTSLDQALHDLQLAGLRPIITHPERNPLIRMQSERFLGWLRQGCYAQITAQSFSGRFGRRAKEAADKWLRQDAVHFVASDAHDLLSRPLRLKEAYEYVASEKGSNVAQALFHDNPLAVIEGRPLPYVPELPQSLEGDATVTARRKRFWLF